MSSFASYYWTEDALGDSASILAFKQLLSDEFSVVQKTGAFLVLLRNHNPAAQCVAFDYFFYYESLGRYGLNNPFSPYSDELLTKARKQLQTKPIQSESPSGTIIAEANYASALGVLAHLGVEEDIDGITQILKSSYDATVIFNSCLVLQRVFGFTQKHYPEIVSIMIQIIKDDKWTENIRIMGVRAFANYKVFEIEEVLVDICKKCSLPISAYAAVILGNWDIQRHRNFLQKLSDKWPENAQYPASEVRSLLNSTDMLNGELSNSRK